MDFLSFSCSKSTSTPRMEPVEGEEPEDLLLADVAFIDFNGNSQVSALYHTGAGGNTVVGMATSLAQKEMAELFRDSAVHRLSQSWH
jgi:hypothetical protein